MQQNSAENVRHYPRNEITEREYISTIFVSDRTRIDDMISNLQYYKDNGWVWIDYDEHGCCVEKTRLETDAEYEKRIKKLKKQQERRTQSKTIQTSSLI
jgi:ribosomal protein L14E/L6E/L27E